MSTFNKYRLKGAFHYEWYETEDWYRYLVDRCVKFCNGTTIDIGCGDGLLLDKIMDKTGFLCVGIDADPVGLGFASNNKVPNLLLNVDEENINISAEYLACLNTIEHLERPDRIKDLIRNNISRGAIITTIDYQGGSLGEDHKFEWTYDQLLDFFKEFNPKGFRYKNTEWIGVEMLK